jgi:hypothetical protein
MTEKRDNDLSREEQEAFHKLAGMCYHSLSDEDRIVKALRKRGFIRPSRRQTLRWFVQTLAAAAILIVTFLMGVRVGDRSSEEITPVVKPVREDHSTPSKLATDKTIIEDSSVLDDYRDEPDRPGNVNALLAKTLD